MLDMPILLALKKSFPYIKCFYCSRNGHTKDRCWRKKLDYVFNRMVEMCKQKDQYKSKKEKQKQKIKTKKIGNKNIRKSVLIHAIISGENRKRGSLFS